MQHFILTGHHATDSRYNIKLNDLIERYNLTQYDTKDFDFENVSVPVRLNDTNAAILDKPFGAAGVKTLGKAGDRYQKETDYTVKRQAKTNDGLYYELEKIFGLLHALFPN